MDEGLYHIHCAIQICMVLFFWFCVLKPILFSPSMSVKNHASMAVSYPSPTSLLTLLIPFSPVLIPISSTYLPLFSERKFTLAFRELLRDTRSLATAVADDDVAFRSSNNRRSPAGLGAAPPFWVHQAPVPPPQAQLQMAPPPQQQQSRLEVAS